MGRGWLASPKRVTFGTSFLDFFLPFTNDDERGLHADYEDWLEDGWAVHAPVGSFRPNACSLHDTIGNVWEWCRDAAGGYDADVNPGDGLRKVTGARSRVNRGGSFSFTAAYARSALRYYSTPESRSYNLGVRPARVITE